MTPNGNQKIPVQKSFFDLDSFENVTLKKFFDYTPVTSVQDALARLGNDSKRLIQIVNQGLINVQRNEEYGNPEGWSVLTDEGELNGAFTGTPADQKAVNALVLTLAKTVFQYSQELPKEARDAAKASAMEMIKNTPAIKEGLKKSAALKVEEENGAEGEGTVSA